MGGPTSRKKHRARDASLYGVKGRRFDASSMVDAVYDDVRLERKKVLPVDLDRPGLGQMWVSLPWEWFSFSLIRRMCRQILRAVRAILPRRGRSGRPPSLQAPQA